MKLLLFSDLHADADATSRLVELSRSADVVVGAGDFANTHQGLKSTLQPLWAVDRPVILVAGNNESTDELREVCGEWPQAHVLHGTAVTLSGVMFFGIGGGIPVTPFGAWSYDFTEEEAAGLMAECPGGCVLVSHSPPQGVVDVSSSGRSLGSTAVREAILRCRPRLVVCGHIHGSSGTSGSLAGTPVVNAGPAGVVYVLS